MKKLLLIGLLAALGACGKTAEQKQELTVNEYLFEPELAKKINTECVQNAAILETPRCQNAGKAAYLMGSSPRLAPCYKNAAMDRECIGKYIAFMEGNKK